MTKGDDFKLLKIQTVVLKVHIHCDGCKQEVKKLLQRIEGVYTVSIDAEHQKVTVSGNVDSKTLIKKLGKSGKHAEIWGQKSNNNQGNKNNNQQQHQVNHGKDGKKNTNAPQSSNNNNQAFIQGLKDFKNQHNNNNKNNKLETFSSDEEDYDDEDDYYDDEDDDDELDFLEDKLKQFNLLKQANNNGNNNGNNNVGNGKKTGNQAAGIAAQKVLNGAPNLNGNRMGNNGAHFGALNPNALAALQGLNGHSNGVGALHKGPNLSTGYPANPNAAAAAANGGFGVANHHHHQPQMVPNLQGYQNNPAAMMMNMRGLNHNNQNNNNLLMNESRFMQQPQVMYNRSPQIPPFTGYCYPYNNYYYQGPYENYQPHSNGYADHLFSDENTSSCAIM